jgi:hypothetical protein
MIKTWKEAVVAYFKVISYTITGRPEQITINLGISFSGAIIDSGFSRL